MTKLPPIKIKDNLQSAELSPNVLWKLLPLAGEKLSDLVKANPQLLVFPHCLGDNEDGIGENSIFSLVGNRVQTGNIVGFIGIDDICLTIQSRFDDDARQHFLHYMLHKVFGINMLRLATGTDVESIWDFFVYLFPYCLKKAMRQGLFRTYRTFDYNNDHMRGVIDTAAHIRKNIPFTGKIAYHTREFTGNNHLIQLVRHTIETIRSNRKTMSLLTNDLDTHKDVDLIIDATPNYNRQELPQVIAKNLRPVRHPYFTEYFVLQRLCLQILRREKLTYGNEENKIFGILFDAAWLWEEYLAGLLMPMGFIHPRNKTKKDPLYLYSALGRGKCYPDFMGHEMILDAKYKTLTKSGIGCDDRLQMIAYMHVTKAHTGRLLFPTQDPNAKHFKDGILKGYGGIIDAVPFHIPRRDGDFFDFCNGMEAEAKHFSSAVMG